MTRTDKHVRELADRLRLAVTRMARRLRQESAAGLTPSMLSALSTVERQQPLSLGELAAAERIAPPTVTRVIDRLAREGLVRRDADPSDKRSTLVSLTEAGRRALAQTRRRKTAYLVGRLENLSSRDRATLEQAARVVERLLEEDEDA